MRSAAVIGGWSLVLATCSAQEADWYRFDTLGHRSGTSAGIGKYFLGREIAATMSAAHADWLDRPEREAEERPGLLIEQMRLVPTDVVADIGCGTGHHALRMAAKVPQGKVFAVDIQPAMLDSVFVRSTALGLNNVDPVLGSERDPGLRPNSIDKVLLVDVYHELAFPYEMMRSLRTAMKPGGRLFLVEFRGEDGSVPIKPVHRMTRKQAVREMAFLGFELERSWGGLPWQHLLVFRKMDRANRSSPTGNGGP